MGLGEFMFGGLITVLTLIVLWIFPFFQHAIDRVREESARRQLVLALHGSRLEGLGQHAPQRDRGGHRGRGGHRLQHAVQPIGGPPERDQCHQVREAAGDDENAKQAEEPAHRQVAAPAPAVPE